MLEEKIDADFMNLFDKFTENGVTMKVFTTPVKIANRLGCKTKRMREAMMRLLIKGVLKIKTEEQRLVRVNAENGFIRYFDQPIDADFMRYFDKLTDMGITVRPHATKSGPTAKFTGLPDYKYKTGKGKRQLRQAMVRLLEAGILKIIVEGPPSRRIRKLVRAGLI